MKNINEFNQVKNEVKKYLRSKQKYSNGFVVKTLNDITLMSISFAKFRIEDIDEEVISHVSEIYLELYSDDIVD